MSIKLMSEVWDHSPFQGATLLIHLSLADHANDDGVCWPSVKRLAQKARISDRQAKRVISEIVSAGFVIRQARYKDDGEQTSNYYLVLPPSQVTPPVTETPQGVTHDTPGVTSTTPLGVTSTTPLGVSPMTPKPSLEPSVEPPGEQRPLTPEQIKIADTAEANRRGHLNQLDFEKLMYDYFNLNITPGKSKNDPNTDFKRWVTTQKDWRLKLEAFKTWWYNEDWRGKSGDSPTLAQIRILWPNIDKKFRASADAELTEEQTQAVKEWEVRYRELYPYKANKEYIETLRRERARYIKSLQGGIPA